MALDLRDERELGEQGGGLAVPRLGHEQAHRALAAAAGLATPRASAWATSASGERFGTQAAEAALANLKAADGDLFKAAWFHPKGPEILDAFSIAINETVTGAKTAEAAMGDAQAKVEKALG